MTGPVALLERRPSQRPISGVTLVELLVAMAIGALVLAAAAGLLSTARAGESTLTRGVQPRQALDLAAELLREEIALAAFVPWEPAGPDVGTGTALPTGAGDLLVSAAGSASQTVHIAFLDDRLATGPVARDLSFSAGRDGRGVAQLYRRSGSSSRQPLVEGIARIGVEGYVDAGGLHELAAPVSSAAAYPAIWAVVLELATPTGEARRLLVELPSRPRLVVEP